MVLGLKLVVGICNTSEGYTIKINPIFFLYFPYLLIYFKYFLNFLYIFLTIAVTPNPRSVSGSRN